MNPRRIILSILVMVLQCHSNNGEKYTVQQLDNNEVVYLETLAKIKLYHEQWKIVVGFDLSDLEIHYKELRKAYNRLADMCINYVQNRDWTCSSNIRIGNKINELSHVASELENVLLLAGVQTKKSRTKRGLFNFVGEISKTLFGTLDDTDAAYYNQELDKLYEDQRNLVQYVKNQTSIILKTFSLHKEFVNEFSYSIKQVNVQFNSLRNLSHANELNIRIDELFENLNSEMQKLTNEIRRSEDLIIDGKHGTVQPYILSPKILFNVLRKHEHIDNFPVPLQEKYYTALVDISDVSIASTEKRLLLQLLIPLIEDKILELIRVISLPRHGWLTQSIIDTTQKLILLDPYRTIFIPINEVELTKAKRIGNYQLLKRTFPDYKTGINDNCLSEILTKHESEKCTTKYMQIQNTLWIQLHTNQDWIGIAPKEEDLHILCSDKISRSARISQNFILHLEPDCTAISDTATLKPENLIKDTIEIHQTIKLSSRESLDQIFTEHNLTDIPMDLITEIHIDPERLQTLGKTFTELNSIADQISEHHRTITWKEKFMYYLKLSGYIALGSILFVFHYKIGLFSSVINLFKQLIGNWYNRFGNRAPTQHVSYTTNSEPTVTLPSIPSGHQDNP